MKTVQPTHTFRICPERGSRLSVEVEIYASDRALQQRVRAESPTDRTRGLVGQCLGVAERSKKTGHKTGLFAIVRIPQSRLRMSTITHEAFHATMRWAERRGIAAIPTTGERSNSNMRRGQRAHSLEERAATVHDELCRRIVIESDRRGLLP